jgi:hypothetical protein
MITLRLEVPRFDDVRHWHWQLLDSDGRAVEYDEISLDPPGGAGQPQEGTAAWMRGHVTSASDRVGAIAEARRWLGQYVLPKVGPAIAAEAPVTVHVRIPESAAALLDFPLELASVLDPSDGSQVDLAESHVAFVYEVVQGETESNRKPGGGKDPIRGTLRVLAIFMEPANAAVSELYVEQRRLFSRLREIATRRNKAIDLRILPYGTTLKRLRDCLEESRGWDIVHLSGYGIGNGLSFWGSERLTTEQLARELKQTKQQLKAMTLIDREQPGGACDDAHAITHVAANLARTLDCAVFAFRYPACETFALTFVQELFVNLTGHKEQRLPGAVQLANKATVDRLPDAHGWCCRPGPVLFGSLAVSLSLAPPDEPEPIDFDVRRLKMTSFDAEPSTSDTPITLRAQAGNALSDGDAYRGVVLVGPAAKTRSCALELAYAHVDDFGTLVWHQGPTAPSEVHGSFDSLIRSLDGQLVNLRMADHVDTDRALQDFMPVLSAWFRERLVLVVIADVDLLLTSQGTWKDPSWRRVIDTMSGHVGGSRLIITSSRAPVFTDGQMEFVRLPPVSGSDDTQTSHGTLPGQGGS